MTHIDFDEVERRITRCKQYLEKASRIGTEIERAEIEQYLTKYLLVSICVAYENEIKSLVVQRARRVNDPHLASYVEKTFSSYRSLKIGTIRKSLLEKFSPINLQTFDNIVQRDPEGRRALDAYVAIVKDRNETAHPFESPVDITLAELEQTYKTAKPVFDALRSALWIWTT